MTAIHGKSIIFIFGNRLSELPPLVTLFELLGRSGNKCSVIVSEREALYDSVVNQIEISKPFAESSRIHRRLNRWYINHIYTHNTLSQLCEKYDIVWYVLASGTIDINAGIDAKRISGKKRVASVYEMFDNRPKILAKISKIIKSSDVVVMPEYNRANIYRAWFGLTTTPIVLPNAPLSLPKLEDKDIINKLKMHHNKIILYQGHIMRIRNLDALCKAVAKLEGFEVVLMGKSHGGYAEELCSKYNFVSHIPFIVPPKHLQFTSGAHIGIVTYDHQPLNGVYCAPNKIWEYSGYGIPMLCNDIPGLKYTVEAAHAGVCIDMSDSDEICKGIVDIESCYTEYRNNSYKMFASVDLQNIVNNILEKL